MGVKYSKMLTATDAIDQKPFTVLVETVNPIGGENFVVIRTLTGEYKSIDEFDKARDIYLDELESFIDAYKKMAKIVNISIDETKLSEANVPHLIPLTPFDAHRLICTLSEALENLD